MGRNRTCCRIRATCGRNRGRRCRARSRMVEIAISADFGRFRRIALELGRTRSKLAELSPSALSPSAACARARVTYRPRVCAHRPLAASVRARAPTCAPRARARRPAPPRQAALARPRARAPVCSCPSRVREAETFAHATNCRDEDNRVTLAAFLDSVGPEATERRAAAPARTRGVPGVPHTWRLLSL